MSQQDMSQRNCHACGQQLGFGTMVKAVDKEWHQGCFNCVECRQPVQGEFRVRGDPSSGGRVELLCCPCDERIRQAALNSAPVCNGCGNRIVSGQVIYHSSYLAELDLILAPGTILSSKKSK